MWEAIIHFDFVVKVKLLRILKGMIPVRDIFLLHKIYTYYLILHSFSKLQLKPRKL